MIAAACGFDAVYIDLEHNPTSLETAAGVCVAALGMGITPIARVTSHDPHDATRILDALEGGTVTRIVVTHRHGDHWASIDALKSATNAPVACHAADAERYNGGRQRQPNNSLHARSPQRGSVTTSTRAGSPLRTIASALESAGATSFGSVIGPSPCTPKLRAIAA